MKILDIILDRLNNTALFEMAQHRKDAKNTITALSPEIVNHLIKLFVFNSPQDKQGWLTEINTWINKIDSIYLKPYSRKIDAKTLYNWMIYDSSPDYSSNYINRCVQKMKATTYKNAQTYDYDAELVLNQILKILNNISKDIEKDSFISIEDYLP